MSVRRGVGVSAYNQSSQKEERQVGQCTTLADRDRHGHIGGGGGRTGDVTWQRAVSRPPCALDTGRSPRPVRSPLTMATGNSTVHVNNMEINRGKTQTSVKQPTASNEAFIRYRYCCKTWTPYILFLSFTFFLKLPAIGRTVTRLYRQNNTYLHIATCSTRGGKPRCLAAKTIMKHFRSLWLLYFSNLSFPLP